jgi:site-specific DNA-methyltransferase (adenine-specific)
VKPYYEHAGITIYHGDCRELLATVAGNSKALVTDPPYGIGFASQPTKWQRRAGALPENWDDVTVPDVVAMVNMFEVAVVWGGNYYALPPSRGWLCWLKPDAPPSMGSFELAWTNQDRIAAHISWSISATNSERVGHPTQKPKRVMTWTLGLLPAMPLVDPFMGSGTTLLAAKELGRRAIGIEIEERYCEIAAKRLSQEVMFA